MFVVDAHRQLLKPDPRVLKQIVNLNFIKEQFDEGKNNATLSLVLNKVDSLAKDELKGMLLLTDELRRLANFKEIFYVSALRRKGIDDLRAWLLSNAKPCNLPVPESDDSGLDRGNIAREILREKIFRAYYKGEIESLLKVRVMTRVAYNRLGTLHWFLQKSHI
jgi:GTP-binding protein Era